MVSGVLPQKTQVRAIAGRYRRRYYRREGLLHGLLGDGARGAGRVVVRCEAWAIAAVSPLRTPDGLSVVLLGGGQLVFTTPEPMALRPGGPLDL